MGKGSSAAVVVVVHIHVESVDAKQAETAVPQFKWNLAKKNRKETVVTQWRPNPFPLFLNPIFYSLPFFFFFLVFFIFVRFVCYLASHAIPPWTQWPPFPFYLWSTIVTDRVPFFIPMADTPTRFSRKRRELDLQKWGGNDINHSWRKSVASWLPDNQLNDQFKRAPLPSKRHTDRHLWVVIDSIY